MGACNFCDFSKCSYEYFDKENETAKTKYGPGIVCKGGKKIFPCLYFYKMSKGTYRLAAMIEEDSGNMNGTSIEISYCPICGRKLGEQE